MIKITEGSHTCFFFEQEAGPNNLLTSCSDSVMNVLNSCACVNPNSGELNTFQKAIPNYSFSKDAFLYLAEWIGLRTGIEDTEKKKCLQFAYVRLWNPDTLN